MIILIPLGGRGKRFKDQGYTLPKSLINIFGKPILYYLLDNLKVSKDDIIYIPYNKEYLKYRFEDKLIKDYPKFNFKFICLENNTEGALETINIALKKLDISDCPILCLDGDNFYTIDIVKRWNYVNKVIIFKDYNKNPIYSYVILENNMIKKIIEKKKISDNACAGAYGFTSYKELLYYSQKVIDKNIRQKNEFYTSSVITEMIENNIIFNSSVINKNHWHCLGTPIQLRFFYNNFPKISCIKQISKIKSLRICFDLDNTLVSYPKKINDYTTVEPIYENISFLKYLKSFGHTIIIYTARRMKTHNGNIGKTMQDIGKITFNTLEKFEIPFDEIYFGKPYADMYIDDLAVNCFDDVEKLIGFYKDTIKPRHFNNLNSGIIETYKKTSKDLSGEIYYYKNIPRSLKDLFPIMIDYDDKYKWYIVEKINGLTITTLYLSQLLTINTLKTIMDSIKRIHLTKIYDNDINIYKNYVKKLDKRYKSYNYTPFKDSDKLYNIIRKKLHLYEIQKKGKISVIHGDPVMTNILINNFNKIKFIDMRGKVGENLTIYGDWLYDWSKLYQSLIGYDKILQGKHISKEYEIKMIKYFEKYFVEQYSKEDFENLKLITQSLLFTLIPLHDNSKCQGFYELINSLS